MSLQTRLLRGLGLTITAGMLVLVAGIGLIEAQPQAKRKATRESGKLDAAALARVIDQAITAKLKAEGVKPSDRADDAEFLRRVHLDLTGKVPTKEAAAAFLADTNPNKRAKLIDQLLDSKEYGVHLTDLWASLMLPRTSDNRRLNADALDKWLEKNFNANTSWDRMVTDLLTATGTQAENGATTYFLANNTVDKMTDSVGKLFMGLQLQCAQCHPHPFTEWTQKQYWETAAYFMKVQPGNVNAAAKNKTSPGVQELPRAKGKRRGLPESAQFLPPKALDGTTPKIGANEALRPYLAKWLCTPENKFFSRAIVNRVWAQLFARGFVNPIDDIRPENVPSHPELFETMARQFAQSGFDLKDLYRAICLSETYQRSSKPNDSNRGVEPTLFARMNIKVLSPEQLYDSIQVVLGGDRAPARPNRPKQPNRPQANAKVAFVNFFNLDENWDPMEFQAGIPQVLRLMNSAQMNNPARAQALTREAKTPAEAVEILYLNVLSRKPTAKELDRSLAHLKTVGDNRQGLADLLWVLVNSSEFAVNR